MQRIADKLDELINLISLLVPAPIKLPDFQKHIAFKYKKSNLIGLDNISLISFNNLKEIDSQKQKIIKNTEQFIKELPANNVLLTGARGTGKSSLVKACLKEFSSQGLRLIEIDKDDLINLPEITDTLSKADRQYKFIIYCDDLSFEEGEAGYKALKSILDGSISGANSNILVYATSNRRHLMPEHFKDNANNAISNDGELHPAEAVEEKISLSERFGLWISFYPFSQEEYLKIVNQWLEIMGFTDLKKSQEKIKSQALIWALERGSRSARVAHQFTKNFIANNMDNNNNIENKKADVIVDPEKPRSDNRKHLNVAVGVIFNSENQFLMTTRVAGEYKGYWEFAGGKIEVGETVEQALVREIKEEINLDINPADVTNWKTIIADYPHALVKLNICKIYKYTGNLKMMEGQEYSWQQNPITVTPALTAANPILKWIKEENETSR